jgi:serine phosphatase RsbU (regulator of sigma subunit)
MVMFRADAAGMGYSEEDSARVMRELRRTLEAQPAVEHAALSNRPLLTGASSVRIVTVHAGSGPVVAPVIWMRVSRGFFSTVGARIVEGRDFDERDTRDIHKTGFRSIIVNEAFARRHFGSRSAVGQRVASGNRPDVPPEMEIVGVVNDFAQQVLRDEERPAQAFFPFADEGELAGDGTFFLRLRGDPEPAMASIRAAVGAVDPRLPLIDLRTFDDQVDRVLRPERMLATLSSAFAAIALLLSVVGLYGVMSFVVTRRTQEIGMRLALGATRGATVWLVMREALTMIAAGIAIALPAAWALRRLVEAELFGVGAFDAPTIAAAGGGLAIVALAATLVPAWRAAVLPPMMAIRDQPESIWQTTRQTVRRAIHDLAGGERSAAPSVTLIGEFTGLVQRSESFPEALRVALPALGERVGARFITLLEKTSAGEYRGGDVSIPARGVLVNRLTHFRHPLPLTERDLDAWLRWAREFRPEHAAEIERIAGAGARIAVALRTKHGIVGILLLAPSGERETFTDAEKQVLSSASEVFALMIENARLNDRALEQEKVRRDLALAAEVQRRLLPPQPPSSAVATLAAYTMPARSIGGDFYDFVDLPDGAIGIALADIAGKGIAAALLTSVVQASLRFISAESDVAAAELAGRMNRFLYRSTGANGYATFFYARFDADGRRLRYVNAGHNPPYLVRRTDGGVEVTDLSAGGTVLGLFPDVVYEDAAVDLRPGDLFVAFTDGVTEARSANGEEFGEERLKDLLQAAVGASAADVAGRLADRMQQWIAGAEQHDDLTFVVVSMNPVPEAVAATASGMATPSRPA